MTRVSFHRLAERELNDAALYYERESLGLGVRFLDEIEATLTRSSRIRAQARRFAEKFAVAFFESFHMEFFTPLKTTASGFWRSADAIRSETASRFLGSQETLASAGLIGKSAGPTV